MARDLTTTMTPTRRQESRESNRIRSSVHGLSKVDAALLGAALVVLGERVNSASGGGATFALPAGISTVSADQNFELSLSSLRSANAEVSLLSSLVSSVRKNVSEELSVSKSAQAVSEAYPRGSGLSEDLEQYLADAGRPISATELGVDGGANISGKSYIAEMESLESASQEFLNIMRQLFAEELDSVAERQQQEPAEEDKQEVAKEETEEQADGDLEQEVADDGGLGSPWMGLLGLAGGGGGGGGLGGGGGFGIGGGVIDGYVSGATVFWDINSNFIMDANESAYSTITGADGSYSLNITSASGQIVVMDDGVDISTGGSVGMMAMSLENASDVSAAQITPLTMLAAQGIDDTAILDMLGLSDDVSIHTLDPVELLEAGGDDASTGGTLLLKAQQIFAVTNAVAALAEESGMTQAEAVSSTLEAFGNLTTDQLDSLVGEMSDAVDEAAANSAIQAILNEVAPDFSASASDLSSAIVKTNQVLGEELSDPTQAMGESARAAALITQNDLVTEFKAVGQMDPETAAADIAAKLSASFSSVADIKANFRDVYQEQIAAQAESGGGIITSVDDITVLAGAGKLIAVSDIIGNDRNTGEGDLRLISIGPAKMTWADVPDVMTSQVTELESGDNAHSYQVTVNTTGFSAGDYVKLDIGPIKIQTEITADDTQLTVANRLVNKFGTMFPGDQKPPFSIDLADDGSAMLMVKQHSQAELTKVKLMHGVDDSGASFTAKIIDIAGEQFVQVDSAAAESGRLNYVVANDDGIGHGMVRLSIEPEFREVAEPVGRNASVIEDGILSLVGQFELTGNYTDGVQERVLFQLDSSMPDGFRLYDGSAYTALTKNSSGTYSRIQIDADNPPSLAMPENYHGEISYGFTLGSRADTTDGKVFTARSTTDLITTAVTADAEAPADQATLGIFIGDDTDISADLGGAIIPVVSGEPNANQTARILLTGGDPHETHSVTLSNIPDGMTVMVGSDATPATVSFGTLTIDNVEIGTPVPIQFTASLELLGSQFGLTDPTDQIRAVVTGEERGPDGLTVLASGLGTEVEFQFDIGASFGLNVTARALTVSDEDVAALLGSLDASVGDGAKLLATVTLDSQDVTLGRMIKSGDTYDPSTFNPIDPNTGYVVTVDGVDHTIPVTRTLNDDGTLTFTLKANSDEIAATYLEGLAVLPTTDHFKGNVTANVVFDATREVTSDGVTSVIPLASAEKGPLTVRFDPVPDGIDSYDAPDSGLVAAEDHSISLASLFVNSGTPIASYPDTGETLYYEVSSIPAAARLVDGSGLIGLTGDALQSAIADAPLIGRVVGNAVQLTIEQAQNAHLVVSADAHLDPSMIDLAAFTREPSTGDESAKVSDSVGVEITAVADAPYLSYDTDLQTRGLVNAENSGGGSYLSDLGLSDKAQVSISATVSLEDLDGSESLWVWVTAYAYNQDGTVSSTASPSSEFSFDAGTLEGTRLGTDGDAFVVKGSDLDEVSVSRDADYLQINGFDGIFRLEAVSLEGAPATAADAITARANGAEGTDYAVQTADLKVQFLQPATIPTLNITAGTGDAATGKLGFTMEIGPSGTTDVITILATDVPEGSYFLSYDSGTGAYSPVGAKAEVPGVWVLPSNVFMDSGVAQTVYLQLPGAYTSDTAVKFTAYAVDELGLTSAQSVDPDTATASQLSVTLDTNATVTDPVMVDVSGDGLQFTSLVADGERADQFFDLTGDGTDERLRAWLAPDTDDAFLVTWDGSGDPVLLTEYLDEDGDPTTNAVEDMMAMAGTDGYVNNSHFSNPLYLWFDRDTDGEADTGEMQALNFTGEGIDVSQFDDVIVTDTATGSIVAASSIPGVIQATYGSNNLSLSDAVVRDVFLPVDAPSVGASVSNMGEDSVLSGAVYYEDNPDGFELAASLENPDNGLSWKELFGLGVDENYPDGTTFLLTVRAKTSGTTFNLSDGARLQGEPTDTWLVASWDGGLPSETGFSLKMFVQDDLSGEIPLEFRATKVFTSGGVVQQDTVVRDVTLDIAAQAEMPNVAVPENIIDGGLESDAGSLSVNLSGITASSPDPGEAVEVVIKTTKAIADLVDFELNGVTVQAVADPDAEVPVDGVADTRDYLYTLAGPIADGDLNARVDQYAAGTFSFAMDVTTTDGSDTSTLSGLPFQFKVAPVAQQAEVSVSASSSSEADGSLTFSVDVGSVDADGSEFISQISLSFALSDGVIHPGTETDVALLIAGESYAVESLSAGNYAVTVPGDLAESGILSGQLDLPGYFDGLVSVSASAVTVESSLLTETAISETVTGTATVAPVSDGLAADGLTLSGKTLLGSESVTLEQLIQVQTLDPDETVNIQISSVPGDAIPKYLGSAITDESYNSDTGVWTLSGLTTTTTDGITTVQGLDAYSLTIADLQTDFALGVEAVTTDGSADQSATTSGIIYIDARPLFSPEFVDIDGATLNAAALNVNEDGSGVLSGINVLVGNQLNPTGTEIRLSLDTTQIPVSLTASVLGSGTNLVPTTSAGIAVFTLTAAEIARGVEFNVDSDDVDSEHLSGSFGQAITLQATTNYGTAGTKTSDAFTAGVNVNPTVDGVAFNYSNSAPVSMTEDGIGVSVESLFSFPDTSEVIDSLVVGQSSSLSVKLTDGTLISLANGPFEITALENVSLVPVANANGASRVQLTANVRDAGENGAEGSTVSSQTTEIAIDIVTINDNPVALDDTLTLSEDAAQTLFDVLANDTDIDGDILQLQTGSVRIASTVPGENSPTGTGSVEIDADTGRIAYKPATDFYGTETIAYVIQDGNGGTDSATLTITVLSVDEPSKISARTGDSFDEDTGPHTIDVVGENVTDPDGDPVSLVSVSTDGQGSVSIVGNQISYQPARDFDGSETLTFTVTDGTTQVSSSFEIDVDPVFDSLVLDEIPDPEDSQLSAGLLAIYADSDRSSLISEAVVNDGRIDLGADLTLHISVGGFSTSDPSETASIAIDGQGVVAGSRLVIADGDHAGTYNPTEITTGTYEFIISGIGGAVSAFDAEILIPKQNSGYGSKALTVTTRVNDGYTTSEAITETEAFSIFSTIPPAPFVQLAADIDPASLDSGVIALDDLIRVAQGNDSHVLEIFGLPAGAEVLVGNQSQTEILFRSSYEAQPETGFRVSFADWDTTTIKLPGAVISGDELLSIGARVGTSDGTVNGAADGDTRFVYSRLVETEINLGGKGTSVDDILVNADGSTVISGDGDDTVTVTGLGSGALDGGIGRDTLNLGQLSVADAAVVDLNLGSMTVVTSSGNADQSQIHRDIDGFETVLGTSGDDVIVGSGVDTESMTLRGGAGSDRIYGGAGDDLIDGGAGYDQLAGGAGSDRFVVDPGTGSDTVTDFDFTADSIVISGFGLSPLDSGALPSEVALERSAGDGTDWMLRVTKTDSGTGQILTASVTLAGTAIMAEIDLLGQLTSPDAHAWVTFSETLDLVGSDPEASAPDYGVDLGLIVGDTTGYADSFFGVLDYGDTHDSISDALGVIADAKYESALIERFAGESSGIEQSMDLSAYAGLSGSVGDDVLIGLDQDSVLYGGDNGSDRIIGGLGDDILIASAGNDTHQTSDELTGGAGADVFAFVNAGTVDAGLKNVHDVLVNDFNRDEGDRLLLAGYDDPNNVVIHDVDISSNTQRVSLEDGLTVMFDLSFAREFDSNFALRLADFDKFEG